MKWFNKWFEKKCREAWENANKVECEDVPISSTKNRAYRRGLNAVADEGRLASQGTNFTLYNANGGTVVELRDYDPMNDRHKTTLYVIGSEADLGQQLAHIVTIEALKR